MRIVLFDVKGRRTERDATPEEEANIMALAAPVQAEPDDEPEAPKPKKKGRAQA